jgi:hypothetical protein
MGHLLGLAAAAETRLRHPVAEALRSKARQLGVNVPPCNETRYQIGLGVEGQVNGYYVRVGNERFMRPCNISTDKSVLDRAGLHEKGFSSLYISVGGQLAGFVLYSDKIRDESRPVIRTLHEMGIKKTIMLTDYAGLPINRVLGFLPKAINTQLSGLVRIAVLKGLVVAVDTLDDKPPRAPATGFSSLLAGVTGGVSGLFGFGALAIELPLTTTLMLRAIAEIAQHQGEDLSTLEARLACLEVFAYSAKHTEENLDVGYYATVNIVFMDHFQRVAHAHFTLRRLERTYGSARIRERYAELAPPKSNAVS